MFDETEYLEIEMFLTIKLCIYVKPDIDKMVRVFANGLGDLGSISGRVIQKAKKMVLA